MYKDLEAKMTRILAKFDAFRALLEELAAMIKSAKKGEAPP